MTTQPGTNDFESLPPRLVKYLMDMWRVEADDLKSPDSSVRRVLETMCALGIMRIYTNFATNPVQALEDMDLILKFCRRV